MFFKNDYEFCVNEEVKHYGGDRDGLIFRDRIDQEIFNYSHVSYGYKFTTIEMTRPNCNLKLLYFVAIPQESEWEYFKDEILADFEIRFLKCKTIFDKFNGHNDKELLGRAFRLLIDDYETQSNGGVSLFDWDGSNDAANLIKKLSTIIKG